MAKIEARIREASDIEALIIAHALHCDPWDLYPRQPPGLSFREFLERLLHKSRPDRK